MTMFDDPHKQLKWMEQELLAAETEEEGYQEEDFDEAFEETAEDYDDDQLINMVNELIREEPGGFRNPAVDFSRTIYADEEFDEDASVTATKAQKRQKKTAKKEAPQKNTNIRGLVFLACLEILGILAIIGWWLRWLI